MNNFELIDDYLANRLQEQDKKAFEQQMEGDPALKGELEFQKEILEGVRHARTVELKQMLNNVPISGSTWSGGKIAAGIISAGLVTTVFYFYLQNDPEVIVPTDETKKELVQPEIDNNLSPADVKTPATEEKEEVVTKDIKSVKEKSTVAKDKTPKPVTKPDLQVVDPTSELKDETQPERTVTPSRGEISAAKMEVITEFGDKKHTFHYQFAQGKLLLFGPFDKSLYEILEIHGDGHALFLFYRENYYLLDEKQVKITPLSAIKDPVLLQKLKDYRGQ